MRIIEKKRGSIFGDEKVWERLITTLEKFNPTKIFVLTDSNTKNLCLPHFYEQTSLQGSVEVLTMTPGETNKNIATCIDLWNTLSNEGADRGSILINLGGGVVTDLGGFVASTFKRGIEFINIPTSLLAMVDASVGGKNGVDLGNIKNQIGVIQEPLMVLIDTQFLETLPVTQFDSGLAEMLKHGLISSEAYWKETALVKDKHDTNFDELVWQSIEIKNKIVTEDPKEKGKRKLLNYGHTLGHAIESYFLESPLKPTLLHGEAIAIGMILATYISHKLFQFPKEKLNEIASVFIQKYRKANFNKEDIDDIINLLIYDKKNLNGKVLFVLLKDFGKEKLNCEVENELIEEAFEYYKNL